MVHARCCQPVATILNGYREGPAFGEPAWIASLASFDPRTPHPPRMHAVGQRATWNSYAANPTLITH